MFQKIVETIWNWIEDPLEDFCDSQGIEFYSVYRIKQESGATSAIAFFLGEVLRHTIISGKPRFSKMRSLWIQPTCL